MFREQQRASSFLVPPTVLAKPVVQYRAEQRDIRYVIHFVVELWAPRMDPHKSGGEQSPPSLLTCIASVSISTSTPHPYALLLGKTDAVDVGSFPYFRDEHVVSVSCIYRT